MSDADPPYEEAVSGLDLASDSETMPLKGEEQPARKALGLHPGSRVGRYLIIEKLGEGGMGIVYKAYDPDLDRRIALKVLRSKRRKKKRGARATARLIREAQALAQLSHPNVVAAYDVGTLGADIYVAMELVEGQSLHQWQKNSKPSQEEIIQVMMAAGRGIAAAHRAGIVHRDIKPDNIVRGNDGRVRVVDFGLARALAYPDSTDHQHDWKSTPLSSSRDSLHTEDPDSQTFPSETTWSEDSRLRAPLTVEGSVIGTPGYMAPEQYLSVELDEYSDQYSFCASLFRLLYGRRPHAGKSPKEIKILTTSGQIENPHDPAVPAWLRKIVMRGLALRKQDRFASMEALLQALDKNPRRRRRRWLSMAAVTVLLATGLAAVFAWQAHRFGMCHGASDILAQTWNDASRQSIRHSFLATGVAFAADTQQRVEQALGKYAEQWVAMHTEACEATRVRGEQSAQMMDLRMACLARRLDQMQALLELFSQNVDRQIVERASRAVSALPSLTRCADRKLLSLPIAPPDAGPMQEQVKKIRSLQAQAQAHHDTGKFSLGLQKATVALGQARNTQYPPLLAEVLYLQARIQFRLGKYPEAEKNYLESWQIAESAGDDYQRALTGLDLMHLIGDMQGDFQRGMQWSQITKGIVDRLGKDTKLSADWHNVTASILTEKGDYDQALSHYRQALSLREKLYDAPNVAIGVSLNNMAYLFNRRGESEKAARYLSQALAIHEQTMGPEHPFVGTTLDNLSLAYSEMGRYGEAEKASRRALVVGQSALGPDHPAVGKTLEILGWIMAGLGRSQEAMEHLNRARQIIAAALGADHPDLGWCYEDLGAVYVGAQKWRQADKSLIEAQRIFAKTYTKQHPRIASVRSWRGCALTHLQKSNSARRELEAALSLCDKLQCEPVVVPRSQFCLAQLIWQIGCPGNQPCQRRARALAGKAQQAYARMKYKGKENQQIKTWLAQHTL